MLSLIATYALCHASTYFDKLKGAIDACYELFSWSLRTVMVALPLFYFVAFLDYLLDISSTALSYIAQMIAAIAASIFVLLAVRDRSRLEQPLGQLSE